MTSSPPRPGSSRTRSSVLVPRPYRDEDEDTSPLHHAGRPENLREAQWQQRVLDLAKLCGWRVAHFRPGRTSTGWRTAVEADGAGFPDLTMVREGRLLFVELKSERGRVTPEQRVWLAALSAVPGVETYLWRPSDWPAVHRVLARDLISSNLTPPTPPPAGDPRGIRPFSPRSSLTRSDDLGEVAGNGRRSSVPPWPAS
jgi:hypothetical protein